MQTRTLRAPRFVDLFCGAGLFSGGFAAGGFQPVHAVDTDPDAIASYRANVAECAVISSVKKPSYAKPIDVLLAGPPCQGFSTLGACDPDDDRNKLALAIPSWSRTLTPKVVVVENVPPFLESPTWKKLVRSLHSQGFETTTWILDASDFGCPQRRLRAFTVASSIGLPEPPRPTRKSNIAGAVFRTPIRPSDRMHIWQVPANLAQRRIELIPPGGDRRDILRQAPEICPPSWFKLGCQVTDSWGRIALDAPANTIRCTFQNPSKGRYLHPSENRVISLREGARLQGVPDSWNFVGRRYPVARQIGNGVPLPLGRAVADQLRPLFN